MNPTCHEEFGENYAHAGPSKPPLHHRSAHSGLRAGSSPERRAENDQGCPNPCRRDEGPVDCKTQSVRRRLAEELGCCGCTKLETPCLVTEDTSTSCRRSPAAPRCCSEPKPNDPAPAYVDPVDQIINEGLMPPKKRRSSRPRGPSGRERRARPSTANHSSYQPDYFDDQADMSNWQQHRDHSRLNESRGRPSSPPPRPKCFSLAFEPYVDSDSYSPVAAATPGAAAATRTPPQDENDGRRLNMQRELERLDEQRAHLMECLQKELKIIEMMREHKRQQRDSAAQQPRGDDRERLQRKIDEEKRKLAEFQRRPRQQDERCAAAPSGTYEIPADSLTGSPIQSPARAAESTPPRQRRKVCYQPPSPDTDTEDECQAPPPRRRLLQYRPPSPGDSSSDGCGDAANACGRPTPAATSGCPAAPAGASRTQESPPRQQSSLQDSFMYYYRAFRNGAPPVTADVPQQTSSTWSTSR